MTWRRTTCLGLTLAGCLADRHPVGHEPGDSPDARAPGAADASRPSPTDTGLASTFDVPEPLGDAHRPAEAQDAAPPDPDTAPIRDASLPFPDLAPLPDAALRLQRSLTMLTQRRFLALTEVDPALLDRPAVAPRRFADTIRQTENPEWRYWAHGRGPGGAAAVLPDGSLALAEPGDCHDGTLVRRFDGGRVAGLGRHAVGTCATSESDDVLYSPDGRWALLDGNTALRLDGSELTTEPPECAGGLRNWTRFVAWDGEDTALATNESCVQRVDLTTGAATELPLPANDCAVVPDMARAATRIGGRLLVSCPGRLALVDADGGRTWFAVAGHAVEARAAVRTPEGAVVLVVDRGSGRTAAVTVRPDAAVVLPVTASTENTLLVADALTGTPLLVTVEPAPPEDAVPGADAMVRITALNSDGTATLRSSALVPSGELTSAVVGDALAGAAFVSIASDSGETARVHVLRGRGERVAVETFVLAVPRLDHWRTPKLRPWPDQSALAVLESDVLAVLDARTDHARLAPIGDPLAYVVQPERLWLFSYEAEAELATLGSDAPLVVGQPVTGNAARLGETATEAVVVHDTPHVGFGAAARVDFIPTGETRPARTASLAGEVLGVVGDWVVARTGDTFEAVHRDTLRRATVEAGVVPLLDVWLAPEAGATLFTFDRGGTLRRVDFTEDAPRVLVVATGIPGEPRRGGWPERHGLLYDRRSGDVLLSVSSEGPGGRVFRLSGAPEVPIAEPSAVLASDRWRIAISLATGGGRALAWEETQAGTDTIVWLVCLGANHCPSPRRLAVVSGPEAGPAWEYQLTPNGRWLVDSEGVTRDLESGGPALVPRCGAGNCVGLGWAVRDIYPTFRTSADGRRMQFWPDTAFLPAEGQIVGLAGVFEDSGAGGGDWAAKRIVSALTPAGAIAGLTTYDGEIRLRRFDTTLDLLEEPPAAPADGAVWDHLHGQLLGSAGDFAVWKVNSEAPEVTTQVVIAEVAPGGAITAPVLMDAEVLEVW